MSKAATDTLEKVSTEFESEVLLDLREGRDQAQLVLESAQKETREAVSKIIEGGARQAESLKRQILGAAELDSRNAHLKSLEKGVVEVFDAAMAEVANLSGISHEKALTRLIQEGLDVIGPKAVVWSSSKDRKVVAQVAKKLGGGQVKLSVADDDVETIGGVVLSTPDGTIRFDNTYEARLERQRPALRKEISAVLTSV